jgi:hypothetical protein
MTLLTTDRETQVKILPVFKISALLGSNYQIIGLWNIHVKGITLQFRTLASKRPY